MVWYCCVWCHFFKIVGKLGFCLFGEVWKQSVTSVLVMWHEAAYTLIETFYIQQVVAVGL